MSQKQDNDLDGQTKTTKEVAKEEASEEEDSQEDKVALERKAFQGLKDNTKSLKNKKNDTGGKLISGPPKSPSNNSSQESNFIVEGHKIDLVSQQDSKPNEYSLGARIQNTVNDSLSTKGGKSIGKDPVVVESEDEINKVDDENVTNRAIRACLAAEAVIAALREECNFLPARVSEEKVKSGHARRGCTCPGKGDTCNATISLQLQLAACENLSFAATSAFRELVAMRLGVPMSTPSPLGSPKKQRREPKKSKKPSSASGKSNEDLQKTPSNLQSETRRGSMNSQIQQNSLPEEQSLTGPFSCSQSVITCEPPPQYRRSSSCDHASIIEPPLPECYTGTLLNGKSTLTRKTADALRAAMKMGVLVVIATGKTRPAAMAALDQMGLSGKGGVLSESTPGVFLQGLQVYGKKGKLIHNIALDTTIVEETFSFSLEHQAPLVGFCGDRCVTLFPHTLVDELHDVFYEPQAEVLECMDQMKKANVQKVVFHDSAQRITSFLRPHWSLALNGRANVVQSLPDMLEVLPLGASKGAGVQILLDHLDVPVDEVMAIGDGENDIEMLRLVGWGVAMGNANSVVKAAAKAITATNDEDGVAKAIEEYVL